MLNIHQLTISFQGEDLLKIFRSDYIGTSCGIDWKNGAGKSTLLKLFQESLNIVQVKSVLKKDLKLILKQDIDFVYGRTILEESTRLSQNLKHLSAS